MFPFLTAALLLLPATVPNTYNERWLCDLWAGAQCWKTSCEKDAKERCFAASRQCAGTRRSRQVDQNAANVKAACALALLKQVCGTPTPSECQGLL